MAWEAAKTATAYVGLVLALFAGVWVLYGVGHGVVVLLVYLSERLRAWQVSAILIAAVLALVWLIVFLGTFCCGVTL